MRKFLVGGNWKMNGSMDLIAQVTKNLSLSLQAQQIYNTQVVIAPPFPYMDALKSAVENYPHLASVLSVAAQNCSLEMQGAFTGEVR